MIFESHAHYDDEQFDEDREKILEGMQAAGVGTIVNVGASFRSLERVLALTEAYDFIYAAIGIHPDEVGDLNEETFSQLKEYCQRKKVVAVGEIGLDYYWDNEPREVQKEWFIRQLNLARELNLPVIIHSREAALDTLDIMKEHAKGLTGVIHCFSYSAEIAREYVKMGFYIGVGGVVTFSNAKKLKEAVQEIGLNSILLETDCPYLAPVPHRGKRNLSIYLPYVSDAIGALLGVSGQEVVRQTEQNAKKMFRL